MPSGCCEPTQPRTTSHGLALKRPISLELATIAIIIFVMLLGLFIIHSLAAAVVVTLFLKRLAVRGWFPRRRLA